MKTVEDACEIVSRHVVELREPCPPEIGPVEISHGGLDKLEEVVVPERGQQGQKGKRPDRRERLSTEQMARERLEILLGEMAFRLDGKLDEQLEEPCLDRAVVRHILMREYRILYDGIRQRVHVAFVRVHVHGVEVIQRIVTHAEVR